MIHTYRVLQIKLRAQTPVSFEPRLSLDLLHNSIRGHIDGDRGNHIGGRIATRRTAFEEIHTK